MSFSNYSHEEKTTIPNYGEHEFRWRGNILEIDFTGGDDVEMSYKFLRQMVEYFGTEEIETDDINDDGCDTCDWGSRRGFVLILHSPTTNLLKVPKLEKKLPKRKR